jgi:ribonuclease VapC
VIFVDASAIASVILGEAGSSRIVDLLDAPPTRLVTSPIAVYEATMAVSRARKVAVSTAENDVLDLCWRTRIALVGIEAGQTALATAAFARFGKGRHKARLNMGDCFAYAAARAQNAKILFVGDDFLHTDLESPLAAT